MMKQVAILGLSHFGKSVLDELLALNIDVFIVDKDREVIDTYKDASAGSVVLDVVNVETLRKVLPDSIDAVVIDMGDRIEASILSASYCAKLGIKTIIVKAETESQAEILELVGATKVVFPNKEAAKRITPQLLSSVLLNYLPLGGKLAIAELEVPKHMVGCTIVESGIRQKYDINLIAVRKSDSEYDKFDPAYRFAEGDIALFSGADEDLSRFTGNVLREEQHSAVTEQFLHFFRRGKK
ncbi:lectin [Spirochaetia bacterium]|nr:lectin [Spirochaetia bacterium]